MTVHCFLHDRTKPDRTGKHLFQHSFVCEPQAQDIFDADGVVYIVILRKHLESGNLALLVSRLAPQGYTGKD